MIGILSVTYKEPFKASPLYKSLNEILGGKAGEYKVFSFYNASSVNRTHENEDYTEQESTENGGLALGYNAGIEFFSKDTDVDYLLFLNSDCQLSGEILDHYSSKTSQNGPDFLYPKLTCNKIVVSPFRKPGFDYDFFIIAWLLVRKSKLKGYTFDKRYWLDGIDYEFSVWFREKGLTGESMNTSFHHDLSVITSYQQTPEWRIINIYKTEKLFLNEGFNFILLKGVLKAVANGRLRLAFDLLSLFFTRSDKK